MDYILDPFIRSMTLHRALLAYVSTGDWAAESQPRRVGTGYFVMHPLLRYLTIRKINERFNPTMPTGIFQKV
jgi:hypothetical protein